MASGYLVCCHSIQFGKQRRSLFARRWTEAEKFSYYSGTWTTPQEVVDKLLVLASKDFSEFAAQADDFICEGDRVVFLGAYVATVAKTGKSFRAPFAHIWEAQNDKITKFVMYTDTAIILEAL